MSEGKDHSEDYIILRKATEATGPSVGEAGAIDELEAFPDGWEEPKPFVRSPDLITIELTREEAEAVILNINTAGLSLQPGTHTSVGYSARNKISAALKGNP